MSFTKKQKALLADCATEHENMSDGVRINGDFAEHSVRTAQSLEERGFLSIGENDWGDKFAYFTTDQYADWREMTGVANVN